MEHSIRFNRIVMESLRSMVVFVKVAEMQSFKKAADALALSPSVVSHHVAKLEDQVNTPLLYRNTRNLALTEDGLIFLQASMDMLKAASDGFDAISSRSKSNQGELRVALPTSMSRPKYLHIISEFEAEYPQITLTLSFSDIFSNHIESGYDIALVFGEEFDQGLGTVKISEAARVIVCSPDIMHGRQLPQKPDDLLTLDWIWLGNSSSTLTFTGANKYEDQVDLTIKPRLTVDNSMASRRLAIEGMGLAIVADFVVEQDIEDGTLIALLDEWELPSMSLYATWPKSAIRANLTHVFVDFMLKNLN